MYLVPSKTHRVARASYFLAIAVVSLMLILFLVPTSARPSYGELIGVHAAGIVIATLVMFTGIGGGILWFPIFVLLGVAPNDAVALSLITQIIGKSSGTVGYLRTGQIDRTVCLRAIPFASIGISAGFACGLVIPERSKYWLLLLFAFVVLSLFLIMIRSIDKTDGDTNGKQSRWGFLLIACGASFLTGLLSIGSSDFLIPFMERRMGLSMRRAVASGIVIMWWCAVLYLLVLVTVIVTTDTSWPNRLNLLWASGTGVAIGGQIGPLIAQNKMALSRQKTVFSILLLLSSIGMFVKFALEFVG